MKKYLISLGATTSSLLFASQAHANVGTTDYLTQIGGASQLGDGDLMTIVGSLLNTVLSFLGIVLLFIVLYAGFLWMTAGGDEDKVKKSKSLMINAVIGLIITLAAFAISNFVFDELISATGSQVR